MTCLFVLTWEGGTLSSTEDGAHAQLLAHPERGPWFPAVQTPQERGVLETLAGIESKADLQSLACSSRADNEMVAAMVSQHIAAKDSCVGSPKVFLAWSDEKCRSCV